MAEDGTDSSADATSSADSGRRLICGLGNPGEEYRLTRHNLGFRVVECLARRWGVSLEHEECRARLAVGGPADLAMPLTYMNRSGFAVRCLVTQHDYRAEGILVVYDEVSLPLGRLRLRPGGSPGGHRGMESVVENLRTQEIPRLRLGIAPAAAEEAPADLVEFVLSRFSPDEVETVEEEIERAATACEAWIEQGTEAAMNRFNG